MSDCHDSRAEVSGALTARWVARRGRAILVPRGSARAGSHIAPCAPVRSSTLARELAGDMREGAGHASAGGMSPQTRGTQGGRLVSIGRGQGPIVVAGMARACGWANANEKADPSHELAWGPNPSVRRLISRHRDLALAMGSIVASRTRSDHAEDRISADAADIGADATATSPVKCRPGQQQLGPAAAHHRWYPLLAGGWRRSRHRRSDAADRPRWPPDTPLGRMRCQRG